MSDATRHDTTHSPTPAPAPGCNGRRRMLPFLVVAIVVVAPAPVAAQESRLEPGAQVRIAAWGERSVYRLIQATRDTLFVAGPDADFALPVASIQRLELGVPRTRGQQVLRDAGVFGLIGFGSGWLLFDGPCLGCRENWGPVGGIVYGLAGGVIGLVVGAVRSPGLTWRRLPLDEHSMRVAPSERGLGLAITWGSR